MAAKSRHNQRLYDTDLTSLKDHIKSLRRYACALVGDTADADDLVQETLKRALTYCNGETEIRNLRAYLMTVLRNARVDMVRHQIRAGEPVRLDGNLRLAILPNQIDRVACREVGEAIQRLPETQREVLVLVGLEGMAYEGAAEILGVPIGTVMSRLNRARRSLRDYLKMETGVDTESGVLTWRAGRPIVEASLSLSAAVAAT